MEKARSHRAGTVLRAASSLAWFAMLRPTEYMLTGEHPEFDRSRHLRGVDIEFYKDQQRVPARDARAATHMTSNIKQSKTDHQRLGATLTIGATGGPNCPVRCMYRHMRERQQPLEHALFPAGRG